MPRKFIEKYLSDSDLISIEKKISEIEEETSGEIKLCIKVTRGIYEDDLSPREIAIHEFQKLGMHNTKDRTGILIFILFDERKFEVIADEGIYNIIPDEEWDIVKNMIVKNFQEQNYLNGILEVIDEMGSILIKEFPGGDENPNELSNEVIVK